MVIIKREDVTKKGFCKILWRKLPLRASLLLVSWVGWTRKRVGPGVGCLFEFEVEGEGGRVGVGAYSRWALIRGWVLIRINTVTIAWENSRHFTTHQLVSPRNDVIWGTNAEIPYWWHLTTYSWNVLCSFVVIDFLVILASFMTLWISAKER